MVLRLLVLGQLALRVGEEVGAVAAKNMKDKNLSVTARLAVCCGFELGFELSFFELNNGGLQRLTELHSFIVRRSSPGVRHWY